MGMAGGGGGGGGGGSGPGRVRGEGGAGGGRGGGEGRGGGGGPGGWAGEGEAARRATGRVRGGPSGATEDAGDRCRGEARSAGTEDWGWGRAGVERGARGQEESGAGGGRGRWYCNSGVGGTSAAHGRGAAPARVVERGADGGTGRGYARREGRGGGALIGGVVTRGGAGRGGRGGGTRGVRRAWGRESPRDSRGATPSPEGGRAKADGCGAEAGRVGGGRSGGQAREGARWAKAGHERRPKGVDRVLGSPGSEGRGWGGGGGRLGPVRGSRP
ncbi:hypothetical protein WJX79_004181 [Trebouxia sp. C0005]